MVEACPPIPWFRTISRRGGRHTRRWSSGASVRGCHPPIASRPFSNLLGGECRIHSGTEGGEPGG